MGHEPGHATAAILKPGLLARQWYARFRDSPLAHVGPDLITGVADDDPSGIATYSQAGAQFGLNMLWTMPLALPLMASIQIMCARLGRVTGMGLAANIKAVFPPVVVKLAVILLLVATVLNIAADIAAMGDVTELVTGFDRHVMTAIWAIVSVGLQVFVPYHRYVRFLKWLTLSLLAYAAVLFVVPVPWGEVALRTVWPDLAFDGAAATMVVGVFGTTISPYLFFWQASEEVEDISGDPQAGALLCRPDQAHRELRRIYWDTWSGMFYSDITAYFIMLATAVTLNAAGIRDIDSAAQAATALRPVAGQFAFEMFALGILGVGLIGVPVLAGSGAYAMCESMGWKWGLERGASDARGFYGVIALSVLAGTLIQYLPINVMKALFWSAVINGVVAVPLIAVVILLVSRPAVMGVYTAPRAIQALGWIGFLVMAFAAVRMLMPA